MGFINNLFRSLEKETQIRIYETLKREQVFLKEINNRKRIYDDSRRLMETTKNLQVFKRRSEEVLNFTNWIFKAQAAGMPVKIEGTLDKALLEYKHDYITNILRISKDITNGAHTNNSKEKAKCSLKEVIILITDLFGNDVCIDELNELLKKLDS